MRRLCVTGTYLGQRKHNEFRACALIVPSVRLALVWRCFGVYIHTWKNVHIFTYMQKMCVEVDAHNRWITLIRRTRKIINEFWRTPSESQRTVQNSSFFVRWTCVLVCVTGPTKRTEICVALAQRAPLTSNECWRTTNALVKKISIFSVSVVRRLSVTEPHIYKKLKKRTTLSAHLTYSEPKTYMSVLFSKWLPDLVVRRANNVLCLR